MRVLLVAGSPSGDADLVASLASDADTVVAVDSGAALCLSASVVPALVIGDLDSLTAEEIDELQSRGVTFSVFPSDKDLTDLSLALEGVRHADSVRVTATGVIGGRIDHTLAAVGSLVAAADLHVRIAEKDLRGWVLSADHVPLLALAGTGATVSIVAPLATAIISCRGMRWPLDHHPLEPLDSLGVSNLITGPVAEIEVHEGVVLVMSPVVDGVAPAVETEPVG